MRKKMAAIAGQGVRTRLESKKKTTTPGLAAAVENVQVRKEVVAMATSDSKEGENTSICSVPSVMESPKQANTLNVQAQVASESCSCAVGSVSCAAESCSSEASQEAAARHAGSQEGSAAGCEEAMESAETGCCVAEEVLREKPNPAAAMAQVGAMHLSGPNHSQIIRALRDIKVLEEKRNILEGSISNMVAGLSASNGTERSKAVRKIVFMSNDLEDIENNITRVLAVIQPWKEVFDNHKRFQEMEENELKKLLKDFSFSKVTVIHGGGNVGPLCADSQVPETVSVPSTTVNTNANINAVAAPGGNPKCNKAAGSTNMAAPLTNKTVCDAAVRENVAGESSVTEVQGILL
ncbi:hypothetical protein XELAEV_18025987mg [Xenopus laevis]|uniref:Uncharacterized protein n=1 Tax=Xenopus laevis TaxID=8355 RepID=A0A974D3D6_XENLA|nr:hypothetical protein XELAEV_18025987mg [Xenopus laevis]